MSVGNNCSGLNVYWVNNGCPKKVLIADPAKSHCLVSANYVFKSSYDGFMFLLDYI